MAKSADAADLKSAGAYPPWGFKSPSGHHRIDGLGRIILRANDCAKSLWCHFGCRWDSLLIAFLLRCRLSLPPVNVLLSRVDKLRRDEEDGEDTAEGLHA